MPRKITQAEVQRDAEYLFDQVLHAIKRTTPAERLLFVTAWCQNPKMHWDDDPIVQGRNLRPVDILTAGLIEIDHPLVTRPNGDAVSENLTAVQLRIIRVIVHSEAVPIPVGTTVEQARFVPMHQLE
jgi:hypothetical protein